MSVGGNERLLLIKEVCSLKMILSSYVDPLKHTSMYDRGDEGKEEICHTDS